MMGGARVPAGLTVYAIGDIHGQYALFADLLHALETDLRDRAPGRRQIVVLGDFIDHGAGSARMAQTLAALARCPQVIVLRGNHEQALIETMRGSWPAARMWAAHGGGATLEGFGADPDVVRKADPGDIITLARRYVPAKIAQWLNQLPIRHRIGGYFFVHAGIRPGVSLWRQNPLDMLWIREEFTESQRNHGAIIVHGHSRVDEGAEILPNRIAVDSGAYDTGRLSAVGLCGTDRWIVEARAASASAFQWETEPTPAAAGMVGP